MAKKYHVSEILQLGGDPFGSVESINALYFFQPNEHLISSHVYKPVIINPSHLATMANFVPARPIIEDPGSVTGRFSFPLRVREPRPSRRMGSILRLETSHRHRPGTKPISSRTLNRGERDQSVGHLPGGLTSGLRDNGLTKILVLDLTKMSRPLVLTLALGQISLGKLLLGDVGDGALADVALPPSSANLRKISQEE